MFSEQSPARRGTPTRYSKNCFLIVCPRGVAEAYFHWLTGVLDHQVVTRIVGYSPSETGPDVIKRAAALKAEARRKGSAFDEVWVVLEIDSGADGTELTKLASGKRLRLVRVSPCIEVWLIAHLDTLIQSEDARQYRLTARKLLPRIQNAVGQDLTFEPILGRYSIAKGRAEHNPAIAEMIPLVESISLSWQRFSGNVPTRV